MRNWLIGAVMVIVALGLLYGAAASSTSTPNLSWIFLALFAALAATGIMLAGRAASRAGPPPEYVERPGTGPRYELPGETAGPSPWAGTGRTLAVMAVALVGLLLFVAAFISALYMQTAWVVYPALVLTAVLLVIIIIFASPRSV